MKNIRTILLQKSVVLKFKPNFSGFNGINRISLSDFGTLILMAFIPSFLNAQSTSRVDCSKYWPVPVAGATVNDHLNATSFTFPNNTTYNGITGKYNSPIITASNTINNTVYEAITITLNQDFKASSTANSEVKLTNNCPCIYHGYSTTGKVGLILPDGHDDNGAEPYPNKIVWNSPNIWIRRNNDDGTTHLSPVKNQINYIKVKVLNTNDEASSGQETLTVSWGPTSIMGNAKCGTLINSNNATGHGTLPIGIIQPGESSILTFPFIPQTVNDTDYQYSIQATINESSAPNLDANNYLAGIRDSNKKALKNLTIVNSETKTASVLIGNQQESLNNYNLELLVTDDETGKPIYQEAEVHFKMDSNLYNSWLEGNKQTEQFVNSKNDNEIVVKGNNALLKGLPIGPDFLGSAELDFNYLIDELTDKTNFSYHLVQHDAMTDEIVGGCAFAIEKEIREPFQAEAEGKEVDKFEPVTLSAQDIGEQALYNWYDNDGNLVLQGKDLYIANAVAEKYKLEVISSLDGFKDYTNVEVKLKPSRLISISPNPSHDSKATVYYKINEANSAYIMVTNYYMTPNGTSCNYIVDVNATEKFIDISDYPVGFYKLSLVVDGVIMDIKILSTL